MARGKNRVDREFLYSREKSRSTGNHVTPAIHLNDPQISDSWIGSYDMNSGSIFITGRSTDTVGWRVENRPPSVHGRLTASGWQDPTSYYHNGSQWSVQPATCYLGSDPSSLTIMGDGWGWSVRPYVLPAFPEYLETSAVNKALAQLKNQQVNLSTAFLERKETAELAVSTAKIVANLTDVFTGHLPDFLKRGNGWRSASSQGNLSKIASATSAGKMSKKRIQQYKDANNRFLEYQYGAAPLMQDVHGAVAALNAREKDSDAYRATVFGRATERNSVPYFAPISFRGDWGYNTQVSLEHHSLVRLDYYMDNGIWSSLANLGITNPLHALWDRVPWSFVIDWFIPVGNYLSNLDADLGWSFKAGSITRFSKYRSPTVSAVTTTPVYPIIGFLDQGSYDAYAYNFQRAAIFSSPSPRIPSFKNPLSGQHIANAIALALGRFF